MQFQAAFKNMVRKFALQKENSKNASTMDQAINDIS